MFCFLPGFDLGPCPVIRGHHPLHRRRRRNSHVKRCARCSAHELDHAGGSLSNTCSSALGWHRLSLAASRGHPHRRLLRHNYLDWLHCGRGHRSASRKVYPTSRQLSYFQTPTASPFRKMSVATLPISFRRRMIPSRCWLSTFRAPSNQQIYLST